jgi:hypothetical protein
MLLARFQLMTVRSAATTCAKNPPQPFSFRRVNSSFDWIPEHARYAFSPIRFERIKGQFVVM